MKYLLTLNRVLNSLKGTDLVLLLLFSFVVANRDNLFGTSKDWPAASCQEIYQRNPTSRGSVGQYWIRTSEGSF